MKTAFPERARAIPGLDGLRAVAILMVFAYHGHLFEFGWAGVQLFFVLSGFLITGILLDMKESLPAREYFVKFYGRRFLRIFPLYYSYLGLITLLASWFISVNFRPQYMRIFLDQVWAAVLYVYDLFYRAPGFQQSQFLDHFWTLSVEEQFYILWPLLLMMVRRQNLKKLFISFIFLGIIFRAVMYGLYLSGSSIWAFREPFQLVIYSWPLSHLDAFAFGAYISQYPLPRARQQLLFFTVLVPAVGLTATFLETGSTGWISALGYDLPLRVAYQFLWGPTLLNYFFTLLIFAVAREEVLIRILELPWLRYVGKISYGIYVYHFPVMWLVARFLEERMPDSASFWPGLGLSAMATLLMASLSYHLLERPMLRLKDRYFTWLQQPPFESRPD